MRQRQRLGKTLARHTPMMRLTSRAGRGLRFDSPGREARETVARAAAAAHDNNSFADIFSTETALFNGSYDTY